MTTNEAIAAASSLLPRHSIFATKELASHYHKRETGDYRSETVERFDISILPGLNDTPCQRFAGESFERCIELIRASVSPIPTSGNDE